MGEASDLHASLEGLPASELLPPRLRASEPFRGQPVVRDVLVLPGGCVLAVFETEDEVIAAPLALRDAGGAGARVRRAVPGEGAYERILALVRESARVGRFRADPLGDVPEAAGERAIDVDQSNDSVVVGERVVVKLFPRGAPGPHPGIDLPAHLAAVGFPEMPTPHGTLTWTDDAFRPVLLASAAAFLPGARDGWDWYLEDLLGWLDGGPEGPAVEPAAEMGGLVGRLHLALAAPSHMLPEPVRRADAAVVEAWRARAVSTLEEALALTAGEEGERLLALAGSARAALAGFDSVETTPAVRIHGDLHVGQVLRWAGGRAVADFDGNPLAPAEERVARLSPAKDVASFVRSLDHLGRILERRRPDRKADVETWTASARARFLDAYRAEAESAGSGDLFDERLLRPFEVAQECHEYVYAARYYPYWVYVPDLAMRPLLEGA